MEDECCHSTGLEEGGQDWQQFYRLMSRDGPAARQPCDAHCRTAIVCRLVTFDRSDQTECEAVWRRRQEEDRGDWGEDWGWGEEEE